jgi:sugar lactone lactonase YvrE
VTVWIQRCQPTSRLGLILLLVAIVGISVLGAPPATNDVWDISQGVSVTATSGLYPGSDARDMFGGNLASLEPGNTLFTDGKPDGFVHDVEWQTLTPVTIRSFRLFAVGDGPEFNNEREFARFTLKAKSPGSSIYDLVLYSFTPSHPYPYVDATNYEVLEANLPGITAQSFRAEFVQFNGQRGFDGPRIIELDGFAQPLPTINDGIPDSWRQQYFGAGFATDPRAAATADPDGDGAINFQEYLAGTNPLDPNSVQSVPLSVSTFAGSAVGGEDGYRTEATFNSLVSLTYDPLGRLWVTEGTLVGYAGAAQGAHRIRMMDLNEVFHTVVGSTDPGLIEGPVSVARFAVPNSVAFDHHGNVFVVERANHRIRRIDANHVVSTFAGSQEGYRDGVGTQAMFDTPFWAVTDGADNLYVADWANLRIRKVTPDGVVSTYAGGNRGAQDGPLLQASFNGPNMLAFGPDGSLFVSDWANGAIRRIKDGQVTTFAGGLSYIDGVTVDQAGNVYAASDGAHTLVKFTPDAKLTWSIPTGQGFADGPIGSAKFSGAMGPAVSMPGGDFIAIDWGNNRIRQIHVGVPPLLDVSPPAGSFTNSTSISFTSRVAGGVIHYTLNDGDPTPDSPAYTSPITVEDTTLVKARLFVNGLPVSDVLSANFFNAQAPCAYAPAGLVAWWPGDGDGTELVHGQNAVLLGGAGFAPGEVRDAFNFNGTDGYAKVPASPALDVGHGPGLTIEAWINPVALAAQQPIVEWNSGTAYGTHFYISVIPPYGTGTGCLYANFQDTAGAFHVITSPPGVIKTGRFQHVAVTYVRASGQATLYLNGSLLVGQNLGTFTPLTSYDLFLGYHPPGFDGSPFDFGLRMDEVSIYDHALTAPEIASVYAAGAAGKCKPTSACAPTPAGLVGWWLGEGSAADVAGGHDGTISGGVSFGPGKVGEAFVFDGQSGRVLVPDSPALNFGPGQDFSMEAWIKASPGMVKEGMTIMDKRNAPPVVDGLPTSGAVGYAFFLYYGSLACQLAQPPLHAFNASNFTSPGPDLRDGTYHHVAFSVVRNSPTGGKLFVDGKVVLAFDPSSQQGDLSTTEPLRIGNHPTPGYDAFFDGAIDEPSLYSRALSESEVLEIFQAGAAGKCKPAGACTPSPAGLVGWWPGDGNPQDLVGGNSGVLQGGTSFQAGEVGLAFHIGGISNAVVIGNPPSLQLQSFTIDAWIKRASTTQATLDPRFTGDGEIFLYGIGGYGLGLHPDGQLFLTKVGISNVDSGTNRVTDLAYHHVAVTKNGATVVFYIDGVGSSAPAYDPGFVFASAAAIGVESDVGGGSFFGDIDEVQVFNRALATSEVKSIFASGAAGQCKPPPSSGPGGGGAFLPGLAAYWNFDESAGTVAHDVLGVYNGALSASGAAFVPAGISGNALSLSRAANGFVTMGDVLPMTNTDFSVVAWVKVAAPDAGADCNRVLLKQEGGYPNGYALEVNGCVYGQPGKAWFYDSDAPGQEINSVTDVVDGQWHQIAGVYHLNSTKSIYVDGTLQASKASYPIVPNHGALVIGGGDVGGAPQGLFTGLIDDVQIYSRALSSAEVALLFQNPGQIVPHQGIVSTLAGSGNPAFQDGTGTNASFNAPNGGFVGPDHAAYIADTFNHRIRRVDLTTANVSTLAGNGVAGYLDGPATAAQFNAPLSTCVDAAGNVYVADTSNNRIRRISSGASPAVTTVAGNGQRGYVDGPVAAAEFNFPNDLTVDPAGNLYVSEFNNHTIRKITPNGTVSTLAGNGTPGYNDGTGTAAGLNQPAGVAIDKDGNLFVTEWGSHRIRKITPAGAVSEFAGTVFPGLLDGQGLNARFFRPDGIVVDAFGSIYVTENGNHAVRQIRPDATVTTVAGTGHAGYLDGPATTAQFNAPGGIGIDTTGTWVIADTGNHRIRTIRFASNAVVNSVVYARKLPIYYAPGFKFTVNLVSSSVPVSGSGIAYALEDAPPAGWLVGQISDGGVFDVATGKVKLGPFLDSQARTLTYDVTPPSTATGTNVFQGTVSTAGNDTAIAGQSEILPPPLHPADVNPPDFRINISETTAYATAWRKGQTWSTGPNPIPIDYVTRAGLLWKRGELYSFDPTIASPPLWWTSSPLAVPMSARPTSASNGSSNSSSATRVLPAAFVAGEPFVVRAVIVPPSNASVYAVEDHVPAEVIVSDISDGGEYDAGTQLVKWGPFFDSLTRELSFKALVQAPNAQSLAFSGLVSFDGANQALGGQTTLDRGVRLSELKLFSSGDLTLSLGQGDGGALPY